MKKKNKNVRKKTKIIKKNKKNEKKTKILKKKTN